MIDFARLDELDLGMVREVSQHGGACNPDIDLAVEESCGREMV